MRPLGGGKRKRHGAQNADHPINADGERTFLQKHCRRAAVGSRAVWAAVFPLHALTKPRRGTVSNQTNPRLQEL